MRERDGGERERDERKQRRERFPICCFTLGWNWPTLTLEAWNPSKSPTWVAGNPLNAPGSCRGSSLMRSRSYSNGPQSFNAGSTRIAGVLSAMLNVNVTFCNFKTMLTADTSNNFSAIYGCFPLMTITMHPNFLQICSIPYLFDVSNK